MPKGELKIDDVIDLLSRLSNGEKITKRELKVVDGYEPLSEAHIWKLLQYSRDDLALRISRSLRENKIVGKDVMRVFNSLQNAIDRRAAINSTTADYKDGISISFDYSVPTLQQSDDDNAET
jgi:hypothetical protein